MTKIINISLNDFRLIFRDPSLRVFLALPILIFLLVNVFIPYLIKEYPNLSEYVPIILIGASIELSQMFGFIYSFVFIDEKETEVSKIYGVVPISKYWFIIFRLLLPFIITGLLTWLMLIIQPFYSLPLFETFLFAFLISLTTPLISLTVSILSKNKMEGMVWSKILSLITILPIVAFFVPKSFTRLFGFSPIHWAFQGLYNLIINESFYLDFTLGMVYFILLNSLLVFIFSKRQYL